VPYVRTLFGAPDSPVVAASDYMRTVADQIRQWVTAPYVTLSQT
jgi:pyruvate dehydrogenase complex dehydrogenase (E1) component